jgi:1-acyl-sn-glycerol-3-phosphate acyltransferase
MPRSRMTLPASREQKYGRESKCVSQRLAINAGVPVVPVGLEGTLQVLPMHSLNVRPGHVIMRIGDPIPTAHLTLKDRAKLTQEMHNRVADLLGENARAKV